MNIRLFKLLRSPEGDSGGVAVAEPVAATEAQDAQGIATEGQGEAATKTDAPAKVTDWQAYQKMQEKFRKNEHAKPSKADMALMAKYNGKDESTIEGYTPDPDEAPSTKAKKPEVKQDPKPEAKKETPPAAPAIPKSLEALLGDKSPVGAKTIDELPAKVESLHKEFQKLNGERGEVGRVLQEAGVKTLGELRGEITGARKLHAAIEDARRGDPKALAFLGLNQTQVRQQAQPGEVPEGVLDDHLYRHLSPEIQAIRAENAELKRMMNERFGAIDRLQEVEQKNAMSAARSQAISELTSEFATLAAENPALWNPKDGNLHKAIQDYYSKDGDYHPGLKVFNELLNLVQEKKLPDLETALALWERKNLGSRILKAKEEARQPFVGKAPTVGLSDQQNAHSGQFTEFTKTQLKNLGRPGYPQIPNSWVNATTGDLIPSAIPAYARSIVLGEEEE